ncbi:hypothetical protein [Scytonema sp. PCC 10023]|uniref:hypothetical protein n=1 Tax=Scytonema sp. PCC 10023 TaxID=1680591 RepID=UPI0039C60A7E
MTEQRNDSCPNSVTGNDYLAGIVLSACINAIAPLIRNAIAPLIATIAQLVQKKIKQLLPGSSPPPKNPTHSSRNQQDSSNDRES